MAGLRQYSFDQLPRNYMHRQNSVEDENVRSIHSLEDEPSLAYSNRDIQENEAKLGNVIGTSVGIVSILAENLLSHPFVVLRRQCQVNRTARVYHTVPITLIPVIYHLHQRQNLATLWKGLGSTLIVRGLSLGVEDFISKVTPWPKEISWYGSFKSFFQHILLKGVTLTIVLPFYAASLVETVQSDIASEKPGLFDVFREGFVRLLNWGGNSKGRMLPIWSLVLPAVALGVTRYFVSIVVKSASSRLIQVRQQSKMGAISKETSSDTLKEIELNASLISTIVADVLLYPFETILHRLYLQGTRTIIDNLDTGKSVLPILTNYYNPLDCYETCIKEEGVLGLYKGFGALILQYTVHILVIRITRFAITEITNVLYKGYSVPNKKLQPSTTNGSFPTQSYLFN